MKREMFELNLGDRFSLGSDETVYVCIRMYGEHDNVLAVNEISKTVAKFPAYAACRLRPSDEVKPITIGALSVNDVCRPCDLRHCDNQETYLVLEVDSTFDEIRCKVLETGDVTSIHVNTLVKVITHGNS